MRMKALKRDLIAGLLAIIIVGSLSVAILSRFNIPLFPKKETIIETATPALPSQKSIQPLIITTLTATATLPGNFIIVVVETHYLSQDGSITTHIALANEQIFGVCDETYCTITDTIGNLSWMNGLKVPRGCTHLALAQDGTLPQGSCP